MPTRGEIVADLVNLSRWLGAPEQDCAILGEGNTSARLSGETFLIKASGTQVISNKHHARVVSCINKIIVKNDSNKG